MQKLSRVGLAAAVVAAASAPPVEQQPMHIRRLRSLTLHPKVAESIRKDLTRMLDEFDQVATQRAVLLEYAQAARAFANAPGAEFDNIAEAVEYERKCERRLELATAAIDGMGIK